MKVDGNSTVGEFDDGGGGNSIAIDSGGRTIIVGVRLDLLSRELLTWALVKIARSGDRVVALHVLGPTYDKEETSRLLSLVKKFDSVLSVYEGFCNLKQIDLKLKVCRGSSVSKIIVQESKPYAASTVIVGTSQTPHTIRSSLSVAYYCARKLPNSVCVLAVDDGKIVFQKQATIAISDTSQGDGGRNRLVRLIQRSLSKNRKLLNDSKSDQVHYQLCRDGQEGNLPDYVQNQMPETEGSPFLRRVLLRNRKSFDKKTSEKKLSMVHRLLKNPHIHPSAVVYPDRNRTNSDQGENHGSNMDVVNGGIEPIGFSDSVLDPLSSYNGSMNYPKELEGFHEKYSSTCRLFSYQELLLATSNFKPEYMVGKGGSGWVYKGSLPDGKELAVKILKPSEDALKEFISEVEIITTLSHKNVVSLFGFCFEANKLFLVYEYLSRGSLEENLHDNKVPRLFYWEERYNVAVGVAEALNYLHNGIAQPVIHRDVKSSNILLRDDFQPQLSDFGLAQWGLSSSSNMLCNDVAGTFGYLAPEYFMHGKVTDKVDVYAFGVVLLELLSGRKPICNDSPKGQESIVMWAKPILKSGKISNLLDSSLGDKYDFDQIERMILAATFCIRRSPQLRPQISLVLKLLQGDEEVIEWAKQQVNASEELEAFPSNIQTHLNLALLDLEDDSLSIISNEQMISLEDYLQGRWSRTSSFD